MNIDTLKRSVNLIKKENFGSEFRFFLINSSIKLENPLIIDDLFTLCSLKTLNLDFIKNELVIEFSFLEDFKNKILYYKESKFSYYYLLIAKLVSLKDDRLKQPGTGISPFNIIDDLLNILSIYYNHYFSLRQEDMFYYPDLTEEIIKKIIKKITIPTEKLKDSIELTSNLNKICEIREEQFYFLQKGLKQFNNSLYSFDINHSISLCFLISSIETFASKYIELSENWKDYENFFFYNQLKDTLKQIEDEEKRERIFNEIGNSYIKETYKVMVKFREFIFRFCDPIFKPIEDFNGKFFKQELNDIYNLRSSYIHSGKEIPIYSRDREIMYNLTKDGKIKTYDEGSKLDVRVLLPFNMIMMLIRSCIINFFNFLYNNKDNENDKKKYANIDTISRSQLYVTINIPLKPGQVVLIKHIHRKEQYIDIYNNTFYLESLIKEKNYNQLISEYLKIEDKLKKHGDSENLSRILSELGLCYFHIGDLKEAMNHNTKSFEINNRLKLTELIGTNNYDFACYYCVDNKLEESIDCLRKAIQIDAKFKESAKNDSDFDKIKSDNRFLELLR